MKDNIPDYKLAPPGTAPTGPDLPNPVSSEPSKSGGKKGKQRRLRDSLLTLVVIPMALFIAYILLVFVFQSYQVDGPSMQPTLQNNDRLIVWKLPKTWSRITGHQYVPDRGDIVIFEEPSLDNKQLIKRVVGLPGDRVVVKNNVLTVYNKAHPSGFDPDTTLPYNQGRAVPPTSGNIDITVGSDQIYVCGDNRPDSLDSRYFGPVPLKDVIGKLAVRILPVSKAKSF
jgi:signal peptidase I